MRFSASIIPALRAGPLGDDETGARGARPVPFRPLPLAKKSAGTSAVHGRVRVADLRPKVDPVGPHD